MYAYMHMYKYVGGGGHRLGGGDNEHENMSLLRTHISCFPTKHVAISSYVTDGQGQGHTERQRERLTVVVPT